MSYCSGWRLGLVPDDRTLKASLLKHDGAQQEICNVFAISWLYLTLIVWHSQFAQS